MDLTSKIKLFSLDTDNTSKALAMMQIGRTEKHNPHEIMSRVIADVLLRFHNIEIPKKAKDRDYTRN